MDTNPLFDEFPTLQTPRLRLRQIRPSDAESLFAFFSDAAVTRYFGVDTFTDIEQARQRIAAIDANFRHGQSVRWGIARREDDRLIGSCGYVYWKRRYRQAAVGYELARPYWRQGIMSETLSAVLAFGFGRLQLHRVEALVMPPNSSSRALLTKLGFREEGLLRDYGYWQGRFHDLIILSLLSTEWQTEGAP